MKEWHISFSVMMGQPPSEKRELQRRPIDRQKGGKETLKIIRNEILLLILVVKYRALYTLGTIIRNNHRLNGKFRI